MTSKADQLGKSSGFAAASRPATTRRQLLSGLTGEEEAADHASYPSIPLDQLAHDPFNPREELTDIQEMADSLLQDGQLVIAGVVTRAAFLNTFLEIDPKKCEEIGDARFVVIDGNRRLAGAKLAGTESLRCEINDELVASAAEKLKHSLLFAIHSKQLRPLEEARALGQLLEVYKSQRALATSLSKSHVWVSQRLALLNLTPGLQTAVDAGELSVEDARKIGRLPEEEQSAAAAEAAATRQARKASSGTRAGRRTRGAVPDAGEPAGGNGVSAAPPDNPDPSTATPERPGTPGDDTQNMSSQPPGHSSATTAADIAPGTPPAGGNGVSAAPPDNPDPSTATPERPGTPGDDTQNMSSQPPGHSSATTAADIAPGTPPAGGNGVSAAPPAARAVSDWSDLRALASAIRHHLSSAEVSQLLLLLAE